MLEIKKSEWRENIESFTIAILTILFVMIFVARPYVVQGPSMEPTLFTGERLIVNKAIYRLQPPQTGDIVVIIPPGDPTRKYIKRVIAGPGQTISIQDSKVFVNGQEIDEPYIKEKMTQNYDYQRIPEGTIFVMGDNRNCSRDSRDSEGVGFVPLQNIIGKASVIFWPINKIHILVDPKYTTIYKLSFTQNIRRIWVEFGLNTRSAFNRILHRQL